MRRNPKKQLRGKFLEAEEARSNSRALKSYANSLRVLSEMIDRADEEEATGLILYLNILNARAASEITNAMLYRRTVVPDEILDEIADGKEMLEIAQDSLHDFLTIFSYRISDELYDLLQEAENRVESEAKSRV